MARAFEVFFGNCEGTGISVERCCDLRRQTDEFDMSSQQDKANPPPRDNFNTARTEETTNTWLTPLSLIQSLGPFDLDPCCPPVMPWRTAAEMHHYPDMGCGLSRPWLGRVFVNPPYGEHTFKWMRKF